jgi:hypothetical protein
MARELDRGVCRAGVGATCTYRSGPHLPFRRHSGKASVTRLYSTCLSTGDHHGGDEIWRVREGRLRVTIDGRHMKRSVEGRLIPNGLGHERLRYWLSLASGTESAYIHER